MACTGLYSNPAATGGDDLWNFFNLFYYEGYPANGLFPASAYGIDPDGKYIPKISQLQPDGETFVDGGICPFTVDLDTSDYNYVAGTDKMLSNSAFGTPNGMYGRLETNSKHSCLQDITECGGELWCHKIFFPRRSYKASSVYLTPGYLMSPPYSDDSIYGDGTLVAPFGSTSICEASLERSLENRYEGFGVGSQFKPYLDTSDYVEPDYIKYEIKGPFFDVCDNKILTEVWPYDVGIDDSRVSVRDYLPLIGVVHPGWRSSIDTKSCVILQVGCGAHYALPTHTDQSIRVGAFAPKTWATNRFDSMGYYLDKAGDGRFISDGDASVPYLPYRNQPRDPTQFGNPLLPLVPSGTAGADQCLFNPFKILVDVECSTNRHRRLNTKTDDPTNLSFVSELPAFACSGLKSTPPCGCTLTNCNQNMPPFRDAGENVYELVSQWKMVDLDYDASCDPLTGDEKGLYETIGLVGSTVVLGRGVQVAATGGVWLDDEKDVQGLAGSGACSCGTDCFGLAGSIGTATFVYLPTAGTATRDAETCAVDKDYVYEVANTVKTVMWDCENHLYVSQIKDADESTPCDNDNALCNASWRFQKQPDLLCMECYAADDDGRGNGRLPEFRGASNEGFSGVYNEHPTTGWWQSDCGCEFFIQHDYQCTNSIGKLTITESSEE